ncbi:2-succinyl-5-enolpyruvyl-6-hydroxy-3-cyclohexene-1-carboxylic-acid synthase [soil metagenome]
MRHPNPSSAIAWVIVDELARSGVTRAVISPGSRSTALVLALNASDEFETLVQIDERSAGFRALGISAGCGSPGLAVTTSGSAVANLLPAVVEAERSAAPLILLTADRPPEMVRRRTNQTMDQESVFSGYLRGRFQLGPAIDREEEPESWREAVATAVALAQGGPGAPGPVQINVSFEEPTVPLSDDGRSTAEPYRTSTGSPGRAPDQTSPPDAPTVELVMGKRSLVIAGRGDYDGAALAAVCDSAGIPILATALSGARGVSAVAGYHHILVDGVPPGLEADWVYVVGQPGPSDRLTALMQTGAPVVHADRWGLFSDVSGTMSDALRADPVAQLTRSASDQEQGWADRWAGAESGVRDAIDKVLAEADTPTGPGVARSLNGVDWQALVVASSLSIRDVDSQLTRHGWVFANRGLSGIDGFASTALGVAGCRPGTLAVTGDLAFLHDSNAFLTGEMPSATFLVVDNGGGGLFDLLPQAQHAPDFDRLFVTPPERDLSVLAQFHGLGFTRVDSVAGIVPQLTRAMEGEGVDVVSVGVDRKIDLAMRNSLDAAARAVLDAR